MGMETWSHRRTPNVEPRGSVYGVWVLVNKLNLYNLVVVYTIGSMAGLRHWFYPKDNSLLWQQLYRFVNKAIYYVQVQQ